jgi:hypothetical protein
MPNVVTGQPVDARAHIHQRLVNLVPGNERQVRMHYGRENLSAPCLALSPFLPMRTPEKTPESTYALE